MLSKNARNGLFFAAVLVVASSAMASDPDTTPAPSFSDKVKAKWALIAAVPAATWAYVWNGDCDDCASAVWFDRVVRIAGLYTAGVVVYKGAPVVYKKVKNLVASAQATAPKKAA